MDSECKKYWKEDRPKMMEAHRLKARERWEQAFLPDYDYEFFLVAMKAKLENMADYFNTLAPIVNGPYYAGQMKLAVRLLDIVIDDGGKHDYKENDSDDPEDWFRPEAFMHYVNMKNASRYDCSPDKVSFYCASQRIRFNKAWHLFLRILNEKMFNNWVD